MRKVINFENTKCKGAFVKLEEDERPIGFINAETKYLECNTRNRGKFSVKLNLPTLETFEYVNLLKLKISEVCKLDLFKLIINFKLLNGGKWILIYKTL